MGVILTVVKACVETQLDYYNYTKCSEINSIIVGLLKLGQYVNVNNTVGQCIYFVNVLYHMQCQPMHARVKG